MSFYRSFNAFLTVFTVFKVTFFENVCGQISHLTKIVHTSYFFGDPHLQFPQSGIVSFGHSLHFITFKSIL